MNHTVHLTIDGHTVAAASGTTVLEAALAAGIYIPHLCSHEALHPYGACRLCVAKQQGVDHLITTCATLVEEGMVIDTHAEAAQAVRKLSCDFMFKTHPAECTGCPKYGKCQLQSISQYVGDTGRQLKARPIPVAADTANPMMLHEMYRCILCGRCVRACTELRGVGALKFATVNGRTQVVVDGNSLNDAGCRFCTACVEVCPTGAIREHEALAQKAEGKPRDEALVPCRAACPAHVDVPRYLRFAASGRLADAAAVVREKAPLPLSLGYICSHPCENACKRACLNTAVSIRNVKRAAAQSDDGAWKQNAVRKPTTGKRVAVIGAGPAGLTAAYYLAKLGHAVTVLEAQAKAGGMLRYGIPRHRLPHNVIDGEVQAILDEGIALQTGVRAESAPQLLTQGYDAVLVAVGAHEGVRLPLNGADLPQVYTNTEFLRAAAQGQPLAIGNRVAVLGGGNVAMDCAAVAKRLGAQEVHVACLERLECMPASEEERLWVQEEGVVLHPAKTFLAVEQQNGCVSGLRMAGVKQFSFDSDGKSVIEQEENSEEVLAVDTVIFAVGQRPDIAPTFGVPTGRGNRVTADDTGATQLPGIFAAGDAVTGTKSVIAAIAAARTAAQSIDCYLGGNGDIDEVLAPEQIVPASIGKEENFGELVRNAARVEQPQVRCQSFAPMDSGLDSDHAQCEAHRCLQCDLRLQLQPQKFWNDYPIHAAAGEGEL